MSRFTKIFVLALAVSVTSVSHANLSRNAFDADSSDASIRTKVQKLIDDAPALSPSNAVTVQAINGVVYLHGLVDAGGKRMAESIALQALQGQRIVNAIEEGP